MRIEDSVALETWRAWHPAELARRIGSVPKPWCVVGGWALDLWHGRQTRDHEDLEFTVLRGDLARAFCDLVESPRIAKTRRTKE